MMTRSVSAGRYAEPAGDGPEDAHLRDDAGELHLVVEDPAGVEASREDLDLLGDATARGVDEVEHRHPQPRGLLLDAHDLEHGLLAPRARLDRVVVGHDADGLAADLADAGDHAVGRRVGLLVAREEPVLLELAARIEQQLQPIAHEHLALGLELVAVLDVPLLDARPLGVIALFALAHGALIVRGFVRRGSAPRTRRAAAPSAGPPAARGSPPVARGGADRASPRRRAGRGRRACRAAGA